MKITAQIQYTALLLVLFGLSSLSGQSKMQMRAAEGEKVMVIIHTIKAEAKADYDRFILQFFNILLHDKSPLLQEQYMKSRWLQPLKQNADKTWTYITILDPLVEDGDYLFRPLFERKLGKVEADKMMKAYYSYMQVPQRVIVQVQSEH